MPKRHSSSKISRRRRRSSRTRRRSIQKGRRRTSRGDLSSPYSRRAESTFRASLSDIGVMSIIDLFNKKTEILKLRIGDIFDPKQVIEELTDMRTALFGTVTTCVRAAFNIGCLVSGWGMWNSVTKILIDSPEITYIHICHYCARRIYKRTKPNSKKTLNFRKRGEEKNTLKNMMRDLMENIMTVRGQFHVYTGVEVSEFAVTVIGMLTEGHTRENNANAIWSAIQKNGLLESFGDPANISNMDQANISNMDPLAYSFGIIRRILESSFINFYIEDMERMINGIYPHNYPELIQVLGTTYQLYGFFDTIPAI